MKRSLVSRLWWDPLHAAERKGWVPWMFMYYVCDMCREFGKVHPTKLKAMIDAEEDKDADAS